jgi:hypothetical protein
MAIKLNYIQSLINKVTNEDLEKLISYLDQETYNKLFWAVMSREESKEFVFSMKDYLDQWRGDFEGTYTNLDGKLVGERLELLKNKVDSESVKEYHYLQYWIDQESKAGGLFSYW